MTWTALLSEKQAAYLAGQAAKEVPGTCQPGTAHECGSAYCEDHEAQVPELLSDLTCDVAEFTTVEEHDRVAAYLYGRSPELRTAVATFFSGEYERARLDAVTAALKTAALAAAGPEAIDR